MKINVLFVNSQTSEQWIQYNPFSRWIQIHVWIIQELGFMYMIYIDTNKYLAKYLRIKKYFFLL